MFRKKPILHKLKPKCKHCRYKPDCNKKYASCSGNTGFITPCFSCRKIADCKTFQFHVSKGWHVMECPNWIYDKEVEQLKKIEVSV